MDKKETEAYDRGYEQGYSEGYNTALDNVIQQARKEKEKQYCKEMEKLSPVILEEVQTATFRPTELYAVEDCVSGKIIFNARGGCYKDIADATNKISRLTKENGGTYRIVKYVLSAN